MEKRLQVWCSSKHNHTKVLKSLDEQKCTGRSGNMSTKQQFGLYDIWDLQVRSPEDGSKSQRVLNSRLRKVHWGQCGMNSSETK